MSAQGTTQGPPRPGEQPSAPVVDLYTRCRDILRDLPPGQVYRFSGWWADVRNRLTGQAREIATLKNELAALRTANFNLTQERDEARRKIDDLETTAAQRAEGNVSVPLPSSATRPTTSGSDRARRWDMQLDLELRAQIDTEASNTVIRIKDLPPDWVYNRLLHERNRAHENLDPVFGPQGTGCWMKTTVSVTHEYGYQKVNWRNTRFPHPMREGNTNGGSPEQGVPGLVISRAYDKCSDQYNGTIGVQPFIHQLAVVAAGLGPHLVHTTKGKGSYHVSHLCHNTACFNPAHVWVETSEYNQGRKTCSGASMLINRQDGSIINPCPHGVGGKPQCKLPRWPIPSGSGQPRAYYQPDPAGGYQARR